MLERVHVLAAMLLLCGCGVGAILGKGEEPAANFEKGGGSGGSFEGLPCEVAHVLAQRCVTCHSSPPTGGALMPLTSRADLLAPSPSAAPASVGSECVARMRLPSAPMPPVPLPAVPAADVDAFSVWVAAGMPEGSCDTAPDAGTVELTCASGASWTDGNEDSFDMNPGWACQACHLGQNFNGQNPPSGENETEDAWFFMGTVYPAFNERDLCVSRPPNTVRIEILDRDGGVVVTMTPSTASGNFSSDGDSHSTRGIRPNAALPLPYTARIWNGAASFTMLNKQTSGDCNTCHTERGANGAVGRIVYPAYKAAADAGQ